MNPITLFIRGVPYGREKVREDTDGLQPWSQCIEEQTKDLEPVQGECFLKVRFQLSPDATSHCRYGPGLNGLLKQLLDALDRTLFRNVCGHDACISYLQAEKQMVEGADPVGAYVEVYPVEGEDAIERACALGVSRAWAAEMTDPREDVYTLEDGEPVDGTR